MDKSVDDYKNKRRNMRRKIIIMIPYHQIDSLNLKLSEISILDIVRFNQKEINLEAVKNSMEYSSILLLLTHPEFEEVNEVIKYPYFYVRDAKRRYPFLFSFTNPILYRKFKNEKTYDSLTYAY